MWEITAQLQCDRLLEEAASTDLAQNIARFFEHEWCGNFSSDEDAQTTLFWFQFNAKTALKEEFLSHLENQEQPLSLTGWSPFQKHFKTSSIGSNGGSSKETGTESVGRAKEPSTYAKEDLSQIIAEIENLEDKETLKRMVYKKQEAAFLLMFKTAPLEIVDLHSFLHSQAWENFDKTGAENEIEELKQQKYVMIEEFQTHAKDKRINDYYYGGDMVEDYPDMLERLQSIREKEALINNLERQTRVAIEKIAQENEKLYGEKLLKEFLEGRGELYEYSKNRFIRSCEDTELVIKAELHQKLQAHIKLQPPEEQGFHKQSLYASGLRENMVQLDSDFFAGRVHVHKKYKVEDLDIKAFNGCLHYNWDFKRKNPEAYARLIDLLNKLNAQQSTELAMYLGMDSRDYANECHQNFSVWTENHRTWDWETHTLMLQGTQEIKPYWEQGIKTILGEKDFAKHKSLMWNIFDKATPKQNEQTQLPILKEDDTYLVHGHIKPEKEAAIKAVFSTQPRPRDHIKLPEVSWGDGLSAGSEYVLQKDGVKISYVPFNQGKKQKQKGIVATYTLSDRNRKKMIKDEQESFVGIRGSSIDKYYKIGDRVFKESDLETSFDKLVEHLDGYVLPNSNKQELEFLVGKKGHMKLGYSETLFGNVEKANAEDMQKAGYYSEGGFWNEKTSQHDLELWISQEQKNNMDKLVEAIKTVPEKIEMPCLLNKEDLDEEKPDWHYVASTNIQDKFNKEHKDQPAVHLSSGEFTWREQEIEVSLPEAPKSDQGTITIEAPTPEIALEALHQLGIANKNLPRVYGPKDSEAKHKKHPDYRVAHRPLVMPPGKMPLHGMSAGSDDYVFRQERLLASLSNVVESGGLLSTATRRARGINIQTTSPGGDIASGIDMAVGTTIEGKPYIGGDITFVIKPSALERNRVFFSDIDFGGGENRWDRYNQYAKSIGQESILHAPDEGVRLKHIIHNTDKHHNEAWLNDSIQVEEIMAWLVNEKVYDQVVEKAKIWKQKGMIPRECQILKIDDFRETKEHVSRLWKEYYKKFL